MRTNTVPSRLSTHEGATAKHIKPEQQLRRSVMSCLLWEREFYEDGSTIGQRIAELVPHVKPEIVASIAIEARSRMKLRHVPLLIVREMARNSHTTHAVSGTLAAVIQRPDELAEFLSLYWQEGKRPLSAQVKKGLARAFGQFGAYDLAKYDSAKQIKLRDVMALCHPKPKDEAQSALWKRLLNGTLEPADTWEYGLMIGGDKRQVFERLLSEQKLGALALLRNLRNMIAADVPLETIRQGLNAMKVERVLPYRFIAAARYAPMLEPDLEAAMFHCLDGSQRIGGNTVLLVDVSGSMDGLLSNKSDLRRVDAACGLAMLARELCALRVFAFSGQLAEIPARRGFALRDAIIGSMPHGATYLGAAVKWINENIQHDRLVVITDEQSQDAVPDPVSRTAYMINVASNQNGVGYGAWHHIDGWSEAVLDYIAANECAPLDNGL